MREIKFRVWDDINDSMYDWEAMLCEDLNRYFELGVNDDNSPIILMQYTGLKDKNGVEIYEGDIITRMSGGLLGDGKLLYTGRVEYQDLGYVAVYKEKRLAGTSHEEVVSKWGHIVNPSELEIIGNIYENSDILK